jgi:hypothetical protein
MFKFNLTDRLAGLRLKVLHFCHERNVLGLGSKCWAGMVTYSLGYHDWEDVGGGLELDSTVRF